MIRRFIIRMRLLYKLGQLFEQFEVGEYNKTELVRDINTQVKRILKVATDYGLMTICGTTISLSSL